MDEAPFTEDLDLASVSTHDELFALLRTVHLRADKPSLRVLEARTRHSDGPLSKTVVSEMLKGARFPRKAVMLAFLRACGVQEDHLRPWQRAWERIMADGQGTGRPGTSTSVVLAAPAVGSSGAEFEDSWNRAENPLAVGHSPPRADTDGATAADSRDVTDRVNRLRAENEQLRRLLGGVSGERSLQTAVPDGNRSVDQAVGPTVRRRELGILLRTKRIAAGLTAEDVAEHLLCSPGKVQRMESGFRSGTIRDVRDLCALYGITEGPQRDHLMNLARESKQQGWWQSHELDLFGTYLGLENGASSQKSYQSSIIPGLLQTEDYVRAMYTMQDAGYRPERVEELIEVRLTRQHILTRPDPLHLRSIVDEAALRRLVGGVEVMRGQLRHLIDVSRSPNVAVQVIPFAGGAHLGMESNFSILEFADPMPAMVYSEGLIGSLYIERPSDIERFQNVFESLSSIALRGQDSVRFITEMLDKL